MRTFAPSHLLLRPLMVAVALFLSAQAQALTLGQPLVQSQPGEPLRVEIPVQKVSAAEASNLQVKEATLEAYKAARLERDVSLEGLSLELQDRAGQRVLVLTGKTPAKAGFVDVLLELQWATGRMVRDVGVLLGSAENKQRNALPSHLRVQAGDTASQLALNHKDDSVALDQMLLALLRSNPDAFIDNNVNRLKAGVVLTLPDASQAKEVDRAEARQALQLQAEEFTTYRNALAERLPAAPITDNEQTASGKIQSSEVPKPAANQDKLTLAKPSEGEDRIALQREAQETAQRAQEMARNINELSKLVEASGQNGLPVTPPATAVERLASHPLTPVAAGSLLGLLTLLALWRVRRPRTTPQALKVDFDLELPSLGPLPDEAPPNSAPAKPSAQPASPATAPVAPSAAIPTATRPAEFKLEDISLDLSSPEDEALQIRFELAQELWRLGQENTSRTLVQEVAEQATGALQLQAQRWLAERA
jgi:pilus assembly protein FimV